MNNYGISIIICVHNAGEKITPTLKSIAGQNVPINVPCELLIIDNACSDNTIAIAKEFWNGIDPIIPMEILSEPRQGKANALITGYNNASYELMLVCDDDNWLRPDYLKIVDELFRKYPKIGLLGGYGKALLNTVDKPNWFSRWENCYACGKHHKYNGFLDQKDFSIWGAGSVIRKKMWDFLRTNGFKFSSSIGSGKAITEDAELSLAVSFTGHRLYFDDRLWFTHDLRGGRVSWEGLLNQQIENGKNNATLYTYLLTYNSLTKHRISYQFMFVMTMLNLCWSLGKSILKPNNKPRRLFLKHILLELFFHQKKYKQLNRDSYAWISKISNSYPLN